MSDVVGTALMRRQIGREFRALREAAKLSLDEVADQLYRGRGTIARIEEGNEAVRFRPTEVVEMLNLYGAGDEERDRLIQMTTEIRNGPRKKAFHDYESALPERMRLYYVLEQGADVMRRYELELVPGLLQTRRYAEQVIQSTGRVTPEDGKHLVQLRMDRQAVLTRPRAPHYTVILNEAVLRRLELNKEIQAEQIQHMLQMMQRGVSIRVLPFSAGLSGIGAGAFTLMDFPKELKEPSTAFVDTTVGAMYLYDADLDTYRKIWDQLAAMSLTEDATRELLESTLKGYKQ